jgi:tetratricopeptide (TPR) repeat protein
MINRFTRIALLAGCASLLAGCQIFAPNNYARNNATDKVQHRGISGNDQGRAHLRAGRTGQAIEAFNVALATGEDPAVAYNGLGVAYARLGRADLAYRFFKKATTSDPESPVYARNLAMLMDSPGFNLAAMNRGERQLQPVTTPAAKPASLARAPAPAAVPGKLHREAGNQFSLVTFSPESQRPAADADCRAGKAAKAACKQATMPKMGRGNAAPTVLGMAQASAVAPAAVAAAPEPETKQRAPQRKVIDLPASTDGTAGKSPASRPAGKTAT